MLSYKEYDNIIIPYSGKVWQGEILANLVVLSIWQKKFGE